MKSILIYLLLIPSLLCKVEKESITEYQYFVIWVHNKFQTFKEQGLLEDQDAFHSRNYLIRDVYYMKRDIEVVRVITSEGGMKFYLMTKNTYLQWKQAKDKERFYYRVVMDNFDFKPLYKKYLRYKKNIS